MKTKIWTAALVVFVGALPATFPSRLHAMFAPYTDRELIEKSALIVQAEYLGQTEVQLGGQTASVCLGVLAVREVCKGNPQEKVVLIAVPTPGKPVSGSDIFYRPGQDGLWFLAARPGGPAGIHVADHPQRFIPTGTGQARIAAFKKLLREVKL